MSYYEDDSYYCYSEPVYGYENAPSDPVYYDNSPVDSVYYEDTDPDPIYYEDTPSNPIYYDVTFDPTGYADTPSHDELETYAEVSSNRSYTEDEIHPAYLDHPATHPQLEPDHPINNLPHDHAEPVYPPTNTYNEFITYSDEELEQKVQWYEETLQEMIDWDIEDAENKALGRIVPRSKPPAQPYRDSDEFKDIAQSGERARAAQRWRTRQDAKDREDEIAESAIHLPTHPQPTLLLPQPQPTSPFHHDSNYEIITTSPPDICIPNPLPLSPNLWCKPTHHLSAFLIAAIKHREPRYHFGRSIRRRRSPKYNNVRTTSPPDIRTPTPFPPSPNIPPYLKSRSTVPQKPPPHQQPQCPAYTRPQRKHPPARPHSIDHRHNATRRILKKNRRHSF